MKKEIGLLLIIIVLAAFSGCTQQAANAPATTVVTTTVPTTEPTPLPTTIETTAAPANATTVEVPAAVETTLAANVTANVTQTTAVPATTTVVTAGMTPSTKVTVVHIVNNSFSPSVLMVLPGTGITWVNDEKTVHSVKASGDSKGKFNSGDIAPTARWGYTFGESEGTFEFTDGYNLNATGIIIVKKGESLLGLGTTAPTISAATTATATP